VQLHLQFKLFGFSSPVMSSELHQVFVPLKRDAGDGVKCDSSTADVMMKDKSAISAL